MRRIIHKCKSLTGFLSTQMSSMVMVPLRDMMMPEEFYQGLDPGIRFAVRVLHAAGFETCQSCQGGQGHSYDYPTVDLIAGAEDAVGFGALRALQAYGLDVAKVSLVWPIRHGLPYEKLWRIELNRMHEHRANEQPNFIFRYQAT
jgi:hypothetical protein